jgi:CDP-glucose 4,6-dehydratase
LILHLAAQALVPRARTQPLETAAINILGTLHLLEALRELSAPFGLLVATTDKVYEPGPAAHRESDPLGAAEPYAASKAAAELLIGAWVQSWWPPQGIESHGVAIATVRAGNLVGGGDRAPDRLLPDALRAWGQGQPVGLRRPESTRPYLHVLDALSGYFQLLERLHPGAPPARRLQATGPWNFGGPERSAAELIEALAEGWPEAPGWRPTPTEGARVESARLSLDCSRARGELGWTPRGGLNPALAAARRWWTLLDSPLDEDALWERMLEEVRLHPRLG